MRQRQFLMHLALLLALFLWVASPALVDARPGGGSRSSVGRSSSGSSRSGSSSSRSSGGSSSTSSGGHGGGFFFFGGGGNGGGGSGAGLLVFIIIIVIICLILWLIIRSNRAKAERDSIEGVPVDNLPPPTRFDEVERWQQDDNQIEAALNDIRQRDPAFDQAHFIDRVQTAYTILNLAWIKGDLAPALPFLSEGEANRLTMQLEGDRALNRRNVMEDLVLSGVRVVRVEKNATGDVLTARIDASAADYYIDTRTGKDISGWHNPRPYTEYWTFARSGTAKTTKTSYMDRACPNCGAPLELGNISVCQFCGTPVASTEYDWVLMTIDQKYTNE
ncbi:MAG: TIM44-like domain-containing protein [Thermomicrobiales bacterium]